MNDSWGMVIALLVIALALLILGRKKPPKNEAVSTIVPGEPEIQPEVMDDSR